MKSLLLLMLIIGATTQWSFAQQDSVKTISDQIKDDRDMQLQELTVKLQKNESEVSKLTEKLSQIDDRKTGEKIKAMEELQIALDSRIRIIEETPKTRVRLNGQLAFTELLSIQRDIQPADLFMASQHFFTQLGNVVNPQNYNDFNSWKTKYDQWYAKQNNSDQMMSLINNSLNLIGNTANKVPLYGSIVQTVTSGISSLFTAFGKKDKELAAMTPKMLELLNVTSQFEYQKSLIDHDWEIINQELNQLQLEDSLLLADQLAYYGLQVADYKRNYLEETLDYKRENFKNNCRKTIADKLTKLDSEADTRVKWMGQVEIYMYKVQSLRLRFGQLTSKMLSNMERYENLISVYSNSEKFPAQFTNNLNGLNGTLAAVRNKFYSTFRPARYIEDSAVMYIERQ